MAKPPILPTLLDRACERVECRYGALPFRHRGIRITRKLMQAAIEILNDAPGRLLPQHCRNARRQYTPDGLDRRIKQRMDDDTRTANILSDILQDAGIAEVTKVSNPETGRMIKATRLLDGWAWGSARQKVAH